jgi:hypothetical protein
MEMLSVPVAPEPESIDHTMLELARQLLAIEGRTHLLRSEIVRDSDLLHVQQVRWLGYLGDIRKSLRVLEAELAKLQELQQQR